MAVIKNLRNLFTLNITSFIVYLLIVFYLEIKLLLIATIQLQNKKNYKFLNI
jgi:hypothetical protein